MRKILTIAASLLVATGVHAKDRVVVREDGSIVVPQVHVSVEKMLSGKVEMTDEEKTDAKERERHNRAIERELRKIRKKDDPFAFPSGKNHRQEGFKRIPATANRY